MNITHFKNKLHSNVSNKVIFCSLGALVVALLIFQAGIFVGYRKASFSYGSGDNFHRMFGFPERGGMMGMMGERGPGFPGGELTSAYGTVGTIIKITLPTIVVESTDKVEKVILVNDKTIIRQFRDEIKNVDLKVGDNIIVIGSPNGASQIEAKLIRVMPPLPPVSASSTITNIK